MQIFDKNSAIRRAETLSSEFYTVEFEDQKIVENVQKGISSRFYGKDRYSPTREKGIDICMA